MKTLIKGSPVRAVYVADSVHIASFYYKGERQAITLRHLRFEFRGIISQDNKLYRMPNLEKCESINYSILDEDKEILEKCFGDSKIKELISKRINGVECGNAIDNFIQTKEILDKLYDTYMDSDDMQLISEDIYDTYNEINQELEEER